MSWLDLVDKEALLPLPKKSVLLSDNGVAVVYRGNDGWIYKRTIPYFVANEKMFLGKMRSSGFVPDFGIYDKYTVMVQDLGRTEEVTDVLTFVKSCKEFLLALKAAEVRHGDLTKPHIFVVENEIKVIDWGEARLMVDPSISKRQEGDRYWLDRTMREMIGVGLDE